jgi:predicted transcriptional regulator
MVMRTLITMSDTTTMQLGEIAKLEKRSKSKLVELALEKYFTQHETRGTSP